jgi:prepilin-type N-terminal cleavage/methylation domain-containing protein
MKSRWKQLRKLTRNNQKGFTLIELLVVVSIIGILAAVVTMSMVGVTKLAQERAWKAETATVQAAIDTMANEQLVAPGSICPHGDTNDDMQNFPQTSEHAADVTPAGHAVPLYPRYLRQKATHGTYSCDGNGVVTPHDYNP